MVQQLYNIHAFHMEIERSKVPPLSVVLTLTNVDIAHWKENGYFRHLKAQLQNIPTLKFMCTESIGGCEYIFLSPTIKLNRRILNMLSLLFKESKVSLMRCDNVLIDPTVTRTSQEILLGGYPKPCSLF